MENKLKYDVCIVGSGAGAGPIAFELSKAGFKVVVLEKGPWFKTKDLSKDEIVATRRSVFTPNTKDEFHVLERGSKDKGWKSKSTHASGYDFWNGNMVGGSSNLMSAYFHRMKPQDFKLKTVYGNIEGGNIEDWPISYQELEPYYTKVEQIIGVSGKVVNHKNLEPRSTTDFPYPPLKENIVSTWIDNAAKKLNIETFPTPRGILSEQKNERKACFYSNYCGSYGCSSDAKGSSRVSLLNEAIKTGNCTILPYSKVFLLEENNKSIEKVHYYTRNNEKKSVAAKITVVAAQAIETARLLLMSKSKNFPNGIANNNGQVGKNLIFSAGGTGSGLFSFDKLSHREIKELTTPGLWVNRAIQEWYEINDTQFKQPLKGGTVDFVFEHANGITKAFNQKYANNGDLIYGSALKEKLKNYFTQQKKLKFEIFVDWTPTDDCFVSLDDKHTDKWGNPVAKVRLGYNTHDVKIGKYIAEKTEVIFKEMGATEIRSNITGNPPSNLQAGGCRFGNNPKTSVLDKNCKTHEIKNLYIADGSFMPTGGSTTFTFTIYANSFRVADIIKKELNSKYDI